MVVLACGEKMQCVCLALHAAPGASSIIHGLYKRRGRSLAESSGERGGPYGTGIFFFLAVLLMSDLWMCGMTPPPAIVALMSVSSSSSPRMASCKWRGVMRFTLRSLHALPASSSTSAVRYSRMAAV